MRTDVSVRFCERGVCVCVLMCVCGLLTHGRFSFLLSVECRHVVCVCVCAVCVWHVDVRFSFWLWAECRRVVFASRQVQLLWFIKHKIAQLG